MVGFVFFLVLGVLCVLAGVAHWSPPLALVLLGVVFLVVGWGLKPT